MYCRQCEQTAKGTGCTVRGVCGKTGEAADLQDILIYTLEGIAVYAGQLKASGIGTREADGIMKEGLFTTITNVNFDPERIMDLIVRAGQIKDSLKQTYDNAGLKGPLPAPASFAPKTSEKDLLSQAADIKRIPDSDEDIVSLKEILLLGLKGMAAYADHAHVLGFDDKEVDAFFHKGLSSIADTSTSKEALLSLINEFGLVNFKCLELLDKANTTTFGHPEPTKVSVGAKKGPAIIVSGHDLLDLKQLLEQTEGKGINIYTHGEMLPALAYPELKKFKHLAGHFGTAWQNQKKEFDDIPAAILMTTNCIQEPLPSYKDRIFTTGLVAFPDVAHIPAQNGKKDFSGVIKKALDLKGFEKDGEQKHTTIGFARNSVMSAAGTVVKLVQDKKIRHFFLIGGCDGAKPGRNYYTELAEKAPRDTVILTLACGKFRFNTLDLGDIEGLPRLLDCGQCNDSYSAIMIALALAEAFKCSVNELPLSIILSWYEQKAVCVLLTLLSLGIKNIKLGPTLPAFVSPNVLKVLAKNYGLKPITTADNDLAEALKR